MYSGLRLWVCSLPHFPKWLLHTFSSWPQTPGLATTSTSSASPPWSDDLTTYFIEKLKANKKNLSSSHHQNYWHSASLPCPLLFILHYGLGIPVPAKGQIFLPTQLCLGSVFRISSLQFSFSCIISVLGCLQHHPLSCSRMFYLQKTLLWSQILLILQLMERLVSSSPLPVFTSHSLSPVRPEYPLPHWYCF